MYRYCTKYYVSGMLLPALLITCSIFQCVKESFASVLLEGGTLQLFPHFLFSPPDKFCSPLSLISGAFYEFSEMFSPESYC